ncbi:MAG: oligosaccharide flippase family protein [Pseudomonadota bacterium]
MSAQDLTSRLMRGAVLALLVNVAGFSLGFLAQLVVGRTLGVDGFGVYAYVQAWASFIAMLCGIGLPYSLSRFIPEYKGQNALSLVLAFVRFVERRVLVISLGTALVGLGLMLAFGHRLDQDFVWTIYVGLVALPLLALLRVWCLALRASGRIVSALGSDLPVREGVTFIVVAILGLGFPFITSAHQALTVWTLGIVAGIGISLFAWQREKASSFPGEPAVVTADMRAKWLEVAFMLLVVQSLVMLLRRMDLFVVGLWFDKESLGVYAAANRLAEVMIFPTYVLNAYFAPTISELYSQGKREALQKATTFTVNMAFGSAVLLALPLFLFPEHLLKLFGPEFDQGATALRLLVIGEFVATATPFATIMLTMTGHERLAVKLMIITSVAMLAALLFASVAIGSIEAVALARAAFIVLIQLSLCVLIQKKIKVLPYPLVSTRG